MKRARPNESPPRLTKDEAIAEFYDVLLPDPDPASMDIAQDLCEAYGLKLADLGEAMAKNGFENKHLTDTQGWADADVSAGEFVLGDTRSPYRMVMRPPRRGERGWWVSARTSEKALVELLENGENVEGSLGWIAPEDFTSEADEHDMIAVTVERDPEFLATWWHVYHRPPRHKLHHSVAGPGGGYRVGLGAWYGGKQWEESAKGIAGVQVSSEEWARDWHWDAPSIEQDPHFIDKNVRSLPREAKGLRPLMTKEVYRTLQEARRAAASLAWAMAKVLKEGRLHGQTPLEVAVYMRELVDAKGYRPPRGIINPGSTQGPPTKHDEVHAQAHALGMACPLCGKRPPATRQNPPRVFRPQKVVAKLQKDTRPAFARGQVITKAEDVAHAMADYIGDRAAEVFVVLFVNVRNQITGYTELASSSISSVTIDVGGVFREALAAGAAAVVTIHNHPTGTALPSDQDLDLWKRFHDVGKLVGIPVLDNMIIGETKFYSEHQEAALDLPAELRGGAQ